MESGEYSAFGLTGMLEADRDHPGGFDTGSDIVDGFILIFYRFHFSFQIQPMPG